jgi:glycosyltransferase involved in cell wall biosynthesis
MSSREIPPTVQKVPDLSFIMPCYNEEAMIGYTIPQLLSAFEKAGHHLELVAVNNGSSDRTGEILNALAAKYPSLIPCRVEKNQGYGFGVLSGIPLCAAQWVGIIPADGQVDAEDVVRLYEAVAGANGKVLGKVRRRFRMDGIRRKIISITYNLFVRILWPGLGSIDINGSPKILPRDILMAMRLESKEWFLDPEIMIKSHYLGVRVLEFNVFARMRGTGLSHVRMSACWEFFWKLLYYRFSRELLRWRQEAQNAPLKKDAPATS